MSLTVVIALRAEQDIALQHRWYLENADPEVAERYLLAIDQTIHISQPILNSGCAVILNPWNSRASVASRYRALSTSISFFIKKENS